eukprot:212947_1
MVLLVVMLCLWCAHGDPINIGNITDVIPLYGLIQASKTVTYEVRARDTTINGYTDPVSGDKYYYTSATGESYYGSAMADIYDNNLKQFNDVNNTKLSQNLPFEFVFYPEMDVTGSYSCTAPKSSNIIQCITDQPFCCWVWLSKLNKWSDAIIIGWNNFYTVRVSCLNDDTFFIVFRDLFSKKSPTFNYTVLSSNGSYIVQNEILYQIPISPSNSTLEIFSIFDLVLSNFTPNKSKDTINSFLLIYDTAYYYTLYENVSMWVINGYYSKSKDIVMSKLDPSLIVSFPSYITHYPTITMDFGNKCCYVIPFSNGMNQTYTTKNAIVLDVDTKNVGSKKLFNIDGITYNKIVYLINLSMLNSKNVQQNDKYFGQISVDTMNNQTNEILNLYLYKMNTVKEGTYSITPTLNNRNETFTTLYQMNHDDNITLFFGDFAAYIMDNSSSMFVCFWNYNYTYESIPNGQVYQITFVN